MTNRIVGRCKNEQKSFSEGPEFWNKAAIKKPTTSAHKVSSKATAKKFGSSPAAIPQRKKSTQLAIPISKSVYDENAAMRPVANVLISRSTEKSDCDSAATNFIDSNNNKKSNSKTTASNDVTQIRVYYQNVRGLGSKHKKFFCESSSSDHDIVILTETWLKDTHLSAEYFDESYDVYQRDRAFKRGGGVLIATNNHVFTSEEVHIRNYANIEYVCVKAASKTQNVYIYCAYIPPNSNATVYNDHLSAINSITSDPEDVIIIAGDFNLPKVQWMAESELNVQLPSSFYPDFAADFINGLMALGLHQVNSIRNVSGNFLDLIFTNDYLNSSIDTGPPLTKIDNYHPPIFMDFEWHAASSKASSQPQKLSNFKRANFVDMKNFLAAINFDDSFAEKSLDEKVAILHDILSEAIRMFVPTYTVISKEKCPWKNNELQSLKNKKNKEWKRYKTTGDKQPFDTASHEYDTLNTSLYKNYVEKMEAKLKSDPSSFWQYVNSKRTTNNQPKSMQYGDVKSTDAKVQSNLFAKFFGANFSADTTYTLTPQTSQGSSNTDTFGLDPSTILSELEKINLKKGAGPDDSSAHIEKLCIGLGPST